MATQAQLSAWLEEAENALHALSIGSQARVVVDHNGERVEFTATSIAKLQAYITSLKRQLGLIGPAQPAGVIF